MESKENKTLKESLEKEKVDNEWFLGLALITELFSNWGRDAKYDELEKRISKLETKNEIIEKILF